MKDLPESIWIKKHIPKKTSEIRGQSNAVEQMRNFVNNYSKQKKKAIIIYGSTGCGKTSAVYALANELNLEVLEINASDFRNESAITSILGSASKQRSLFSKGKIILVDELDGIAGREDYGGVSALAQVIADSSFPVIMTANDPFDKKFSNLRRKSVLVEFDTLGSLSILGVLKNICEKEKVCYEPSALNSLARRAGGDLRAGINDLQTLSYKCLKLTDNELNVLSDRDQTVSIISALVKVFKTTDPAVALGALNNVSEDVDECFLWVDENLPKEYDKAADLAGAYYYISRADIMRRRIRRRQDWRYQAYIYEYLTAGIAVSKKEKYKKTIQYNPTTRILKLWQANMRYAKRKAIAEKVAEKTHSSIKDTLKSTVPYLQIMFKSNEVLAEKLASEFDLDKDQVDWLKR